VAVKCLLIVGVAYLGIIVLYDTLVRRTNVTRFMFGMRPLKRKRPEAVASKPGKNTV
jgi:hypothetical protein